MKEPKLLEVKCFLDYLRSCSYEHLLDKECYRRIENIEKKFGALLSDYVIWETVLSSEETKVDCNIRQPKDTFYGKHHCLELDFDDCNDVDITPCSCSNVSRAKDMITLFRVAREVLPTIIPEGIVTALWPQIRKIAGMAFEKQGNVYEINYMRGRNPGAKLRMFLQYLTPESIVSILKDLDWDGDLTALEILLKECAHYSKAERLMVDFDVDAQNISQKIGINISIKDQEEETVASFLRFLVGKGLCLQEKADDIIKFIKTAPSVSPCIRNDIAEFKIPFIGNKATMAKVYLGQKSF